MKEILTQIKKLFAGKWSGEGFAKFPTINNTAYKEQTEFIPDEYKDAVHFTQKTWYKNNTPQNDHTVFWDTGFILLKDDKIFLHSVQVGGRIETYVLTESDESSFIFNSVGVLNDSKTIASQRIFTVSENSLQYELNMATHEASFQNHLSANLKRIGF
jgi:THAP4-like, heme-binding beta-barrel domain